MKTLRHIPNALAVTRMALAVPLAYLLWEGKIPAALGLLVVAGVTDLLDGYLAREFGWRTVLGTWLDPAADKILITTALVTLTAKSLIPLWFLLVILGRDLGLVIGVLALTRNGSLVRIRPLLTGKLAVTAQNLTLLTAMLLPIFPWMQKALPPVLVLSTAVTVVSAVAYGRMLASYRRRGTEPPIP